MGKVSRPIWSAIDGDRWGNEFPVERVLTGDSKAENNNRAYLHMSIDNAYLFYARPLHRASHPFLSVWTWHVPYRYCTVQYNKVLYLLYISVGSQSSIIPIRPNHFTLQYRTTVVST
jgi:hypothetical protein